VAVSTIPSTQTCKTYDVNATKSRRAQQSSLMRGASANHFHFLFDVKHLTWSLQRQPQYRATRNTEPAIVIKMHDTLVNDDFSTDFARSFAPDWIRPLLTTVVDKGETRSRIRTCLELEIFTAVIMQPIHSVPFRETMHDSLCIALISDVRGFG